ncbi:MAG: response regulator [Bacteroidota bacterium]
MTKILIIEDDLVDRMALMRMIKTYQLPYQFDSSETLADADLKLSKHTYNLIISDYHLTDGKSTELLSRFGHIPFILISGQSYISAIEEIKPSGAFTLLLKDAELNYIKKLPGLIDDILSPNPERENPTQAPSEANPPASSSNNQIVDLRKLQEVFDGNKKYVCEMIEVFLDQNPEDLKSLSGAVQQREVEAVYKAAHKIKSGFKMMGMYGQEKIATRIELLSKTAAADLDLIALLSEQLISESQAAYAQLRAYQRVNC